MEFYLRWLKKHEMRPGEEAPLGLILCAGKSVERVEVLELEQRGIRVAEYLTELPPREELQKRLHNAIALARKRLGANALPENGEEAPALKTTGRKTTGSLLKNTSSPRRKPGSRIL